VRLHSHSPPVDPTQPRLSDLATAVSSSLDVGFALLSAVALVALTSAVEAGFRSWKAAQRRHRRRGRPASLMSPAASAPSLPKLLGGGGTPSEKAPRALPEGEYLPSPRRGSRSYQHSSPGPSTPPSEASTPDGYRAQKSAPHAALRQLPTIPSAAELQLPLASPGGSSSEHLPREDDWAAAVARGEAWTQSEPWATLWRKSAKFAAEEAAEEAAMLRAEQQIAEEAHWAAVADRQRDMEAAARAGPPAGWANAAAAGDVPPSLASMSASALSARAAAGPGHDMTQAELDLLQLTAAQEAAQERAMEESVRSAHLARVGKQLRDIL
jgi:hypothetical protein